MLVGPDDRRGGSQVRRVKAAETTRGGLFWLCFQRKTSEEESGHRLSEGFNELLNKAANQQGR